MSENVVVTGFKPFDEHAVNASWEAVKNLPEDILGYKIIKEEVEVNYDYVEKRVPEIWRSYHPKLMVHVGVSPCTDHIKIETCANRLDYTRRDCDGNDRVNGHKTCNNDDCIQTGIDVQNICQDINKEELFFTSPSADAGRYLCEYIYYTSLSINKERSLFVHVPPLNKPYSADELAAALLLIVKCALMQTQNYCVHFPTIYKNGRAAATY